MIQIHSSLIRSHGEGLMFIGPSGIGKTTQAELWHAYRNADIINGDMVLSSRLLTDLSDGERLGMVHRLTV